MKHQYFADRRDMLKYELLLDLALSGKVPARILSVLMLTSNDTTAEGSVKSFKQEQRRRELYDFLRACLVSNTRNVSLLRAFMHRVGVDYVPHHDDRYFTEAARTEYFASVAAAAHDHALIFFDPDIGLETGTRSYMRGKGSEKYLMYADVSRVASAAPREAVFMVYQHLQNDKRRIASDIRERCLQLCHAIGSESTTFLTDRDVAFLVTSRSTIGVNESVVEHAARHGLHSGAVAV